MAMVHCRQGWRLPVPGSFRHFCLRETVMSHPANFYPTTLFTDLNFVMQRAQERSLVRRPEDPASPPEGLAFPRLSSLLIHPEDLVSFWVHALEQGLAPSVPMVRDALVAHAHEFLQEVIDALMAKHGAVERADVQRAADAAQGLLRETFHTAFDGLFAAEVVGHLEPDDAPMPDINVPLSRVQQRRVLLEVMHSCVHHAQMHGIEC